MGLKTQNRGHSVDVWVWSRLWVRVNCVGKGDADSDGSGDGSGFGDTDTKLLGQK